MKKLIPAICLLLVSAVMLGTSTFAWFSMNTTVTATGMNITAKSDSKFLQIINSAGSFDSTAAQTSASAATATKEVKPTTVAKGLSAGALTAITSGDAATAIKFYETFSDSPSVATKGSEKSYTEVTATATGADPANVYTLKNTFQVRLNPAAGASTGTNLTLSEVTIASDNDTPNDVMLAAVRVLVICGSNWAIWDVDGEVLTNCENILAATVTTEATTITVYVYFDGEDASTTTNNAATLSTDGYDVEFALTVS